MHYIIPPITHILCAMHYIIPPMHHRALSTDNNMSATNNIIRLMCYIVPPMHYKVHSKDDNMPAIYQYPPANALYSPILVLKYDLN